MALFPGPSLFDKNAIRLPSGVQTELRFLFPSNVKRVNVSRERSCSQTCASCSAITTATRRPSGESRVAWVRRTLNQVLSLARPDRLDGNVCVGPIEARFGTGKEHGLAARQELRPAVAELPFLESCQRLRPASRV